MSFTATPYTPALSLPEVFEDGIRTRDNLPDLFPLESKPRAQSLESAPQDVIGLPTTIDVPGIPTITPEFEKPIREIELPFLNNDDDDDDDCSSVGMATVGEQALCSLKRPHNDDDDSTMKDDDMSVEPKRHKYSQDMSSSDDQDVDKFDDSLSFLDFLAEQVWLMSDSSFKSNDLFEPLTTPTTTGAVVESTEQACHDYDDSSSCSSSGIGSFVTVAAGTSIVLSKPIVWDGSFTFQDMFRKNATLEDFIRAERQATPIGRRFVASSTDYRFLPKNFMFSPLKRS